MSSRRRFFVANWKMTRAPSAAAELARAIAALARPAAVDMAIAPSFPALDRVRQALLGSGIALAAQDVFVEREGAYTGEVSAAMLKDAGVALVLVGHSERRRLRGEREADFARKMARLEEEGLAPLYCVGETRKEREAGLTRDVLRTQLGALDGFAAPPPGLALAYEPVWAIGTGLAATPEMAAEAHAQLRAELAVAIRRTGRPLDPDPLRRLRVSRERPRALREGRGGRRPRRGRFPFRLRARPPSSPRRPPLAPDRRFRYHFRPRHASGSGASPSMIYVLVPIYVIVCVFLVLVVLLQQGKGADVSAAFGASSSQTTFGARGATTLLEKITTWSFVAFSVLAVVISLIQARPRSSVLARTKAAAPATPALPAPAPAPASASPGGTAPAFPAPAAPATK